VSEKLVGIAGFSLSMPGWVANDPDGMRFRPASTGKCMNDNSGDWAVFWEANWLEPIAKQDQFQTGRLTGYGKN
jgi:hypothetical protein